MPISVCALDTITSRTPELTVRRCRFESNGAGVSIEDWNALNIWLWDCEFDGNDYGVANDFALEAAGDFRVIRGRFRNSQVSDISTKNTGAFTIRDSWSHGSKQFYWSGSSTATSRTSLINNEISDYTDPDGHAIVLANAGPYLLLGNRISSPSPTDQPVAIRAPTGRTSGAVSDSVLALRNEYTVSDPYDENRVDCCKLLNIDDRTVSPFTVVPPAMPQVTDKVINARSSPSEATTGSRA